MSIQVQLKRDAWTLRKCICGKEARAYCTDGKMYHVECAPCRIFTVPLSSLAVAAQEFSRVCDVVRRDRMPKDVAQMEDRRGQKKAEES